VRAVLAIVVALVAVIALAWWASRGGEQGEPPRPGAPDAPQETPTRARPDDPTPDIRTGDQALARAAAAAGLEFHHDGDVLPLPPGDLEAMPLWKLATVTATAAGLLPVVDRQALARTEGALWVRGPFLLAGAGERAAALAARLGGGSADERVEALEEVGTLTGEMRAGILGGILVTDTSDDVRAAAAEVLGEERHPGGLEPLVAALGDEDEFVRQTARASLVMYGDAYVRPSLTKAARYGPPRVREMARTILDENFGVDFDPEEEAAAVDVGLLALRLVHDLEGRHSSVDLRADGDSELLVYARGRVTERRRGPLAEAPALMMALASAARAAGKGPFILEGPGLVKEADEFGLALLGREGPMVLSGDLRGAPAALRTAIEAALTEARKLPAAPLGDLYVVARSMGDEEAELTREAGVVFRALVAGASAASLAPAAGLPGFAVPLTRESMESLLGAGDGPFAVTWDGAPLELSVLGGNASAGGR